MTEHIVLHREDNILHIQIDRPKKRNALTQAMYSAIEEALGQAAEDNTRAVVISGSKECFTAGNDLRDFMNGGLKADSPVMRFLHRIATFEKPLIAAVAGHAIGVGTTLLFHCDLVYATADAKLKTPFVDLALVPEAASSLLMPIGLGYQRAAAMLMLGESMSGAEAHAAGVVNKIVAPEELIDTALAKARILATKPPAALRMTKALMKKTDSEAVMARMMEEGQLFMERLSSPEAMEAFSAFMQQRAPDFSKFS